MIVMVPMMALYMLGIGVAYIFGKNANPLATVELLASVVPEISGW